MLLMDKLKTSNYFDITLNSAIYGREFVSNYIKEEV